MSGPATIKLFLIDGTADGLRTAEVSNWSGKAFAGPRSDLKRVLARDEAQGAGVYVLLGFDSDSGKRRAYIGEAESIRARIRAPDHTKREFWTQLVAFVSMDENLTKAHVRWLEGELVAQAKSARRAILDNKHASGSNLPESDIAAMRAFLARIVQLLPILGAEDIISQTDIEGTSDYPLYETKIKGVQARGRQSSGGFLVLSGSQAVTQERQSIPENVARWRQELLESGQLVARTKCLEFVEDVELTSPSLAAGIVHGGSVNGMILWKDSQTSRSLRDIESEEES